MTRAYSKFKVYFLIAVFDTFMTQIYLDLFSNNFRISVAVLILPIIYFFNRRVNPVVCSLFIGVIGMITRAVLGVGSYGSFAAALIADYHIVFFDLTYGLIYYMLLYKREDYEMTRWLLVVFTGDLLANIVELFARTGLGGLMALSEQIYILFYVALIRTIIAVIIVIIIRSYEMFIMKTEHNKRYQHLLLRISELESELYFINQNMDHIEDVMFDSYDLYDGVDRFAPSEIKNRALGIATDIHEIKKNYMNIYTGIKEITNKDKEHKNLKMDDLMSILFKSLRRSSVDLGVQLRYHVSSHFHVRESYYFLTVVRNVLVNAIEAFDPGEEIQHTVSLHEEEAENVMIYRIVDNGPGIKPERIKEIFKPGFSTKFESGSGDANRGLGLYIVRELVETVYDGSIEVRSKVGSGTEFVITIPRERIEVPDEILHS